MQKDTSQRNRILTLLFFGVLMGALDIAVLGPALPSIRAEFSIDERALSWIFNSYVLFNLISTPLMAKLSDLYGRRWVYILDIALFAVGSLLVATSPTFNGILIGRAVQGFGAGGIFPVASAVIGDTFPPEKRGSALGMIGAVFGVAFLIGPLLGGIILAIASWQWLFLINLPIAVLIILFSLRLLPAARPATSRRLDLAGIVLLSFFLTALSFALNQLDPANLTVSLLSPAVGGGLLAALLFLILLIQAEKKVVHPMLPAHLFNRRQLGLAYLLSAGAGMAEASLVFVPLMAVSGLGSQGINEKNATWLLIPAILALAVGSPLAGRLLDRLGSRNVIMSGTALQTAGFLMLSLLGGNLIFFLLSGVLIGGGLTALLGAPIRYIMLGEASAGERSIAQGLVTLFTSIGQIIGSAVIGAMTASFGKANPFNGYQAAFFFITAIGFLLFAASTRLKTRTIELETHKRNEAYGQG